MLKTYVILTSLMLFNISNAAVLLWAKQNVQVPTLKQFSDGDLTKLVQKLNYPKIVAFQSNSPDLFGNITHILKYTHTAYIPNSDINLKDIKVLNESTEDNIKVIKQIINKHAKNLENMLILLVVPNSKKVKRDTDNAETVIPLSESVVYELPKGPILYNANGEAMIYSSRPPLLKTNTTNLLLGKSANVILDKSTPRRLIVTVPVVDGKKVTLRFRFPWSNGYWSLTAVELVDTDGKNYILNITKVVGAPRHFSYHCFGQTVFRNAANNIELILYEMQAQPDSKNSRFDDASDCVPFTTVPIWSGLFVSFTLIIGLFIGLGALGSIKTMDKFENHKTKPLSIALAE